MCTSLASFAIGLDPCTAIAGHHPFAAAACVDLASALAPSIAAVDLDHPSSAATATITDHQPGLAAAFATSHPVASLVAAAGIGQHPHPAVVARHSSLFEITHAKNGYTIS